MKGSGFMKKKLTRYLLTLLAVLILASMPSSSISAQAAMRISRTNLVLTKGQKQRVYVYGLPKGAKLTWKSSKKSVATVQKGTITAKARGNANVTVTITKNKKRLKTFTCKVRVAEKPIVLASLQVSGEFSDYTAQVGFTLLGGRSALLTNQIVMVTPGESQQKLYLLDSQKIISSGGKQLGWLKSQMVRPYNNNSKNIVVAFYARKDYRPFKVTSASKAVFYFWYDGIKYKTYAVDLGLAKDPQPCKLTRLTPLSPK